MKFHLHIAFLFLSTLSIAQGWNKQKGEGYFQINGSAQRSHSIYNGDGDRVDAPYLYDQYSLVAYGEYGFTERITGILKAPFDYIFLREHPDRNPPLPYDEDQARYYGLGEMEIGGSIAIIKDKPFVMNTYALLALPFISETTDLDVRLTDGEFNQKYLLGLGYNGTYPFYFMASAGYNNRVNGYSDAVITSFTAAFEFKEIFTIAFKSYTSTSLYNGDDEAKNLNMIHANNAEYWIYGPELIYEAQEMYGVYGNVMFVSNAVNVQATPTINLGVYYKLQPHATNVGTQFLR